MALVFKREKRKILNPKLLLVALVVLILIPLSSTANGIPKEECLLAVNEGNVLMTSKPAYSNELDTGLIIAHDNYFYSVIIRFPPKEIDVECVFRHPQKVRVSK
jgi:hypothetical protein